MNTTMTSTRTPAAGTSPWAIDPEHTTVAFTVRHMMFTTVRGHFEDVSGEVELNEADPARSSVRVRIGAASVNTRVEARDEHLRSADFFDAANHPELTFESRRIESAGAGRYRVAGDLTIRGVAHEVVLDVREEGRGTDPWGVAKMGFSASTRIDRTAWGLKWNQALETGGVLVGNEIRIELDVQLMAAA